MVNDPVNLSTTHLYDDLNGDDNLDAYKWLHGGSNQTTALLGKATVGPVTPNAWYKMTIKAHAGELAVYKGELLAFGAVDTQFSAGGVALYIEPNTVADWSDILVRKFAVVTPAATFGPSLDVGLSSGR